MEVASHARMLHLQKKTKYTGNSYKLDKVASILRSWPKLLIMRTLNFIVLASTPGPRPVIGGLVCDGM